MGLSSLGGVWLPRHAQPQDLTRIDRGNPLTEGLVDLHVATPGGLLSMFTDLCVWPGNSSPSTVVTKGGIARRAVGGTGNAQYEVTPINGLLPLEQIPGVTIYCVGMIGNAIASSNPTSYSTARKIYGVQWSSTTGLAIAQGSGSTISGATSLIVNRVMSISVNFDVPYSVFLYTDLSGGSGISTLEIDGVGSAASGTFSLSSASPTEALAIHGYQGSTSGPGDKYLFMGGIWLRTLSSAERRQIHANPWQLFAPQRVWRPRYSADVAAGLTLQPDGSWLRKPSPAGEDKKLYLSSAGSLLAKASPGAGDRAVDLVGGGLIAT